MVQGNKALTIRSYYKNFVSISGALAAAFSLVPLLSFLPVSAAAYVFPPLGGVTVLARVGVVVLSAATTYLAFYFPIPKCKWIMALLFPISLISFVLYLALYMSFVRMIPIPSEKSTIQVSIGGERTPFALQTFGSMSDWQMLRDRGTNEEEIWRLWTPRSIIRARIYLFAAVCGFLLPLVLGFSLGVRNQNSSHEVD